MSELRARNSTRARRKASEDRALGFIPARFVKAARIDAKTQELMRKSQGDPTQEDDVDE